MLLRLVTWAWASGQDTYDDQIDGYQIVQKPGHDQDQDPDHKGEYWLNGPVYMNKPLSNM